MPGERGKEKEGIPRFPRPRRYLGQHFLVDRSVVRKIAELIDPRPGEVVLEIGPGRGALTEVLVALVPRLVGVEIDRDLAALLRSRFTQAALRLIEKDILDVDLKTLLHEEGGERLLLVGNVPYNITAPLLFHLLAQADCIRKAVLMLQKEVARRLIARPGPRDYGILSVLLAVRATAAARLEVLRHAFRPVPKVDSAVVELDFAEQVRYPISDERLFARVVRTAFGQRRKMLRNSLARLVSEYPDVDLEEIAARAGIDLRRRPETLSVEDFVRLSNAFSNGGMSEGDVGKEAGTS